MLSISEYKPSEKWLQALKANFSDKSLVEVEPRMRQYLQSPKLDDGNFCAVQKTLLGIDDISTMQLYADLTQLDINVARNKKQQFFIKFSKDTVHNESLLTSHIDQIVFVPRDSSKDSSLPKPFILAQTSAKDHVETILRVTRSRVIFNFRTDLLNKSYDVIFRTPRIPVRLMYHALNVLERDSKLRRYLFPIVDPVKQPTPVCSKLNTLSLYNSSIRTNGEQLQAVSQIAAGPNPQAPYIVFGPPGTGKTTTIVEAILQLKRQGNNRILVTAGSNSACDTIALRIIRYLKQSAGAQENSNAVLRLLPFTRFKKAKKIIHPTILKYSNCSTKDKIRYVYESLTKINLEQYGIVVATLCTVGIVNLVNKFKPKFTHIFIDEAAASIEPESLLGMVGTMSSSCHVILSGDHKQLGAVIKNDRAASLGLGQSLMERLLLHKLYEVDKSGSYDQTLQTRLRRNYRSHPEIVGIYNKLYYNGELIPLAPLAQVSQAANWSVLPNGKFPILFQAAHGATERENHSTSSFNEREAHVLCWYLSSLLKEEGVHQEDIGVISPYLAQCKLLKKMLKQRNLFGVKVGSVESYQGGEKTIIIASMVSSFKSTHFLSNPRRVNVLLSRAKSLMILIGNPITLSANKDFKFIIDQCKENGNLLYNGSDLKDDFSKRQEMEKMNNKDEDSDSDGSSSSDSAPSNLPSLMSRIRF